MSDPAVRLSGLSKSLRRGATRSPASTWRSPTASSSPCSGRPGSGKTTVLRMIAGFEPPTAGTVELGGRDVTRLAPFERDVNTVFQDYALFPHMSVLENVEYGLRVQQGRPRPSAARARRRGAGDRSGWRASAPRKPDQLSGGQRQRVALARALVNRPRVLLLDEPLGALDLKLREEMQVELKAIQREVGITFVFVTHDQDEALTMSDRIAVFNQRPDRAGRHAGRGLRAARHRVRRRLRRHLQPARRRRPRSPCSAGTGTFSRPAREDPRRPDRRPADAGEHRRDRHRRRGRLRRARPPASWSTSTPAARLVAVAAEPADVLGRT